MGLSACNAPGSNVSLLTGNKSPVHLKQVKAIPLPAGFERVPAAPGTFGAYLRDIELKASRTVYLYNGEPKPNQDAQYAILNIPVGSQDLQQCADAVMRLRAAYFFELKQFDKIIFFDNDKTAYRLTPPYTGANFERYLNRVFGMCGSASLSKQLKPVAVFNNIQAGDVLIRGGFPGHAVIVVDVAVNNKNEKLYLLAQSYMPAQDIHILKNTTNEYSSPWYQVNNDPIIRTPEYTFSKTDLKRW